LLESITVTALFGIIGSGLLHANLGDFSSVRIADAETIIPLLPELET
jgi:hypothetical protein